MKVGNWSVFWFGYSLEEMAEILKMIWFKTIEIIISEKDRKLSTFMNVIDIYINRGLIKIQNKKKSRRETREKKRVIRKSNLEEDNSQSKTSSDQQELYYTNNYNDSEMSESSLKMGNLFLFLWLYEVEIQNTLCLTGKL